MSTTQPHKPVSPLKRLIAPFASIKLTVVLLGLSIILVMAGTLAQTEMGIWDVLHKYFRSLYVFIPLRIFFPGDINPRLALPFPGGYTIGMVMLVNLLAAHSVRFKIKARGARLTAGLVLLPIGVASIVWLHNGPLPAKILARSGGYAGVLPLMGIGAMFYAPLVVSCMLAFSRRTGIVLIHSALILLLVGEGVTAGSAVETQMPIYEGTEVHWAQDARVVELGIVDGSDPDSDFVVAIPQELLIQSFDSHVPIEHEALPFSITVDRYLSNSILARVDETAPSPQTIRGIGAEVMAVPQSRASGVDGGMGTNFPGAYLTLHAGTEILGTWMVSPNLGIDQYVIAEQEVTVGDKVYRIALRFRRYYKPYSLFLTKFNHDLYPGTQIPKNFSSDLRLKHPEENVDRALSVSMNNPLRYAGETFFQSGWIPGAQQGDPDRGTVLMVVRNPGWTIPYIACALGTIGLALQFGSSLSRFLKRSKS
ncbi:MAG: hypothetical protein ACI89L_002857 [Phycisphaerales bacterium]|jgi:hypothetical protein